MQELTKNQERNLIKFRKWAHQKSIGKVIQGFLPNFIDDDASNLMLIVDENMQPRTDGKHIWVSLIPYFLDDQYTQEDWLIVLKCMIAHESQHVNSSNFKDIKQIMTWFSDYMEQNYSITTGFVPDFAKSILNIVEDGRIESIAAKRRPGMVVPFKFVNARIRAELEITKIADDPLQELSDFGNNILSYAKTGIYMPGIQIYKGTQMEQEFLKIVSFIDEGVNAVTSADCREAVEQLLTTSADYIATLLKGVHEEAPDAGNEPEYTSNQEREYNDNEQKGSPVRSNSGRRSSSKQSGDSISQDGTDDEGEETDTRKTDVNGNSSGKQSDKLKSGNDSTDEFGDKTDKKSDSNNSSKDSSCDKKDDGSKGKQTDTRNQESSGDKSDKKKEILVSKNQNGTDDQSDNKKAECRKETESKKEKVKDCPTQHSPLGFGESDITPEPLDKDKLNDIKKMMNHAIQTAEAQEKALNSQNDNLPDEVLAHILDRAYQHRNIGFSQRMIILQDQENIDAEMILQAKKLRREIQKIQEHKTRDLKGLRRGTLDSSALWKVGVHSDAVFAKRAIPETSSCAFYLLLDNSGSMRASIGHTGNQDLHKYEAARYASAIVEAAVAGLVPCKIALFNCGGQVNHSVIRTFDDKSCVNRSWNSLKVTDGIPKGYNCDSVNIRVAAEELKRRREKKKILLILSDGEPSAYDSYGEALGEVHDAVKEARRAGVIVIPIMFGDITFLKQSYKQYAVMYEKDILISQPKDIINDLTKIFRILIKRS